MTKTRQPKFTGRTLYVRGVPETLFTAPDGTEYVRCRNGEEPDLVIPAKQGLRPLELRCYETSRAARLRAKERP